MRVRANLEAAAALSGGSASRRSPVPSGSGPVLSSIRRTAVAEDLGVHAPGVHSPRNSPRNMSPRTRLATAPGFGRGAAHASPKAPAACSPMAAAVEAHLEEKLHPRVEPQIVREELAVWEEPKPQPTFSSPEAADDSSSATGLGALQPRGRSEVLQQFLRDNGVLQSMPRQAGGAGGPPPRGSLLKASPGGSGADGIGGTAELEWSPLSDAAKTALRQWFTGHLGGRHAMLVLQHGVGSEELNVADLQGLGQQGGAALNLLSGLHAEMGLVGKMQDGEEGGWLFGAVFSRTPQTALEQALQAAVDEIGDPCLAVQPSDLTVEQAHLALRRLALKAQQDVNEALAAAGEAASSKAAQPTASSGSARCGEKFTRVQIWLELLRLHVQGAKAGDGSSGSGAAPGGAGAGGKGKKPDAKAGGAAAALLAAPKDDGSWHDAGVLRELGKTEESIKVESEEMGLEALRAQNRAIEEYVVHLVRQRDELRQLTKLAEERDSYHILGLSGPSATDSEVKKAYRNLARKEHPDKAGQKNHRKFQAIQQAYNNIQKQRKEGGGGAGFNGGVEGEEVELEAPNPAVGEAAKFAGEVLAAADRVAACAHRSLRGGEEAAEAQALPKRRAFRALRDLTKRGVSELRDAAGQLRILGRAVDGTVKCLEAAFDADKDKGTSVTAIALRDKAAMLEDAGRSCVSSAELLEKIAEATECTLRKVDAADSGPEQPQGRRGTARGADQAANLLTLGTKLLGESLTRIAAVARRSGDEAIVAAMKALDLSRGLTFMDVESRKERRKEACKKPECNEDEPMAAPDAPGNRAAQGDGDEEEADDEEKQEEEEEKEAPKAPTQEPSPRDKLENAAKRVKERHVALRVKNLAFLSSLNEETLKSQAKLRELVLRSEGNLLPDVSVHQKGTLYELVSQLLDSALLECSRHAANASIPPARIFDRYLGFVQAMEHGKEVAVPTDSRTQALRLAALVDGELLCQMIEGPFRQRLAAISTRRGQSAVTAATGIRSRGGYGIPSAATAAHASAAAAKAWEEAASAFCVGLAQTIRRVLKPSPKEEEGEME